MTVNDKVKEIVNLLNRHVGVKVTDSKILGSELAIDFNCDNKPSLVLIVSCVNDLPLTVSMFAMPDDIDVDYCMAFDEQYADELLKSLEMGLRYRPEVDNIISMEISA